jgi:TonB family protein
MRLLPLTLFVLMTASAGILGQGASVAGEQYAQPEFPAAALAAFRGKERIDLFLEVDKNGRVAGVTAFGPWMTCGGKDAVAESLRQAAIDAARKIVLPPLMAGGKPVEGVALIHYSLEGNKPPPPLDEKDRRQGDMVNGKSISMPLPRYPSKAYRFGTKGEVFINVLIDEKGKPIAARPASGHPLLLDAAAKAVCDARWTPTLQGGTPIKVRASVRYNFVR